MAFAILGAILAGCGGGGGNGGSSEPAAKVACDRLATLSIVPGQIGLATKGAVVSQATLVAATSSDAEYCRVDAAIVSTDPVASPILFEIRLPTAWNGKLMQLGGGGWDGDLGSAMQTFSLVSPESPTARGYAVVASDGGHESTSGDAAFALNDEELANFGGDQIKKTHDAALAVIQVRYASQPGKSYFVGASNGGREAFAAFQRWPSDYDGVLALMPAFDLTATLLKLQQIDRAMRADGNGGWFNPAEAVILTAAAAARCDALDGLVEGIVSNPAACNFDPASRVAAARCPGGIDAGNLCLSDVQIGTYALMSSATPLPFVLGNGVSALPAYTQDAGWSSMLGDFPDFHPDPTMGDIGAPFWYADQFVRYLLLRDPGANSLAFDPLHPGVALARIQEVSAIVDQTNPDIDAYLSKGGKLVVLHGQADAFVPTPPTIDYYQALVQRYGQERVDSAVRLYIVPGFGHSTGSFNPEGSLPVFDVLEKWVEQGVAPGNLAAHNANSTPNALARPLCAYPTYPKYTGAGSPDDASSFACA
jgi:poly(3-hydroxybutyrate) depolymerase